MTRSTWTFWFILGSSLNAHLRWKTRRSHCEKETSLREPLQTWLILDAVSVENNHILWPNELHWHEMSKNAHFDSLQVLAPQKWRRKKGECVCFWKPTRPKKHEYSPLATTLISLRIKPSNCLILRLIFVLSSIIVQKFLRRGGRGKYSKISTGNTVPLLL